MPNITLPSADVHYTEHGRGLPLLLLHANPGDGRDFDAVIPALAKRWRVLALDWPGYGQSAVPERPQDTGIARYRQVLLEFITALELPPAVLVGNSAWPSTARCGAASWTPAMTCAPPQGRSLRRHC